MMLNINSATILRPFCWSFKNCRILLERSFTGCMSLCCRQLMRSGLVKWCQSSESVIYTTFKYFCVVGGVVLKGF